MSTREELLVPIAYTSAGELVRPDGAERGGLYSCPGCRGSVGLRGGPGTRWRLHFFHHGDGSGCSPETVLHRAAKRAIREAVERWVAGSGPAPEVGSECEEASCRARHYRPLPRSIASAREEVRLPSGRVADVALLSALEKTLATVEVRVTHAVEEAKHADVAADGLRSIELDAEAVLADPLHWHGLQGPSRRHLCPACGEERRALDAARAPGWVWATRLGESEEEVEREVLRKGRRIVLQARLRPVRGRLVAEKLFHRVEVAEFREAMSHDDWLRALPRWRQAAARTIEEKGLPRYAEAWLVVEQALAGQGGRWLAGLDSSWHERVDVSDADERRARRIDIQRIARETGQVVPDQGSVYWAEPYRCYSARCRAEMLVYTWKRRKWLDTELPAGEQAPGTIELRFSKTAQAKYMANVCPGCGATQGENHVSIPVGPLKRGWSPRQKSDVWTVERFLLRLGG